jgi:hypothetical protein
MKLNPFQEFFMWLTLDSAVVYFVWDYGIVPPFHAPMLEYGHAFLIVFGIKLLCRPIYEAIVNASNILVEIRNALHLAEETGALKFQAIATFLDVLAQAGKAKATAPPPIEEPSNK